ncbi:uncharacterized protein LOC130773607 [Actinidia eriantha]|uniref:uncharacterized protein LOC130773607 n=1 Tax=Actinidia eriantha TaxID=165200 RepID=UPI00258919B0|nr:uncharacterized protein LOC130773607 [Actinidia eriantha]
MITVQPTLLEDLRKLDVEIVSHKEDAMLFALTVEPTIIETIKAAQMDDNPLRKLHDEVEQGKAKDFSFIDGTDGQSERVIQILEDLLRLCMLDFKGVGDGRLLGPQIVQETTEKISLIQQRIRTAQSRQKSYADKRRKDLEFSQGDHVFLKVSPSRDIIRFGMKGKLNPRYIGPVAYRLALPPELANVHNVFHISMLKKYVFDPSHVIEYQPLEIREDLSYVEQPIQILDQRDQVLRNKVIPLVRVLWRNHTTEESTWEREAEMREHYPFLFEM